MLNKSDYHLLFSKVHERDSGLRFKKKYLNFILRTCLYRKSFNYLKSNVDRTFFYYNPHLLEKIFRPYLSLKKSSYENAKIISSHYGYLESNFKYDELNLKLSNEGIILFDFEVDERLYTTKLIYDPKFRREGEITLQIQDNKCEPIYSLSFCFNNSDNLNILIGSLQGPESSPNTNGLIKKLTKQLYGLRPKDLMIKVLIGVANTLNVNEIFAISNKYHVFNTNRYKSIHVSSNYDNHWSSISGKKVTEDFFSLPNTDLRKNPEDISRNKRAMYRKRYAWLDQMYTDIRNNLKMYLNEN